MAKAKPSTTGAFGDIRRYPLENVLRPRLLVRKETVGCFIYECLNSVYEHWVDTEYGNNPDPRFLLFQLQRNLKDEVESSWRRFVSERRNDFRLSE